MAQMDHPNVVSLIGVVTRGRPLYVVLEHMRNGSLKSYLENKDYTPEQQVTWCYQIAAGLGHIHSLSFIHRDVAVRSVCHFASTFIDDIGTQCLALCQCDSQSGRFWIGA